MKHPPFAPAPRDCLGLTERQALCAAWSLRGMGAKQIARVTGLSVGTVKCHLGRAYRALGAATQAELVTAVAMRARIDLVDTFHRLRGVPVPRDVTRRTTTTEV